MKISIKTLTNLHTKEYFHRLIKFIIDSFLFDIDIFNKKAKNP